MTTLPPLRTAHPLLVRLARAMALSEAERSAISQVTIQRAVVQADEVIVRAGDKPSNSFIITGGLACISKVAAEGRQITAFLIPGDMPDLYSLQLQTLDSDIWPITRCQLAYMPHVDLRRLCHTHPRIADELWRDTLVTGAIHREWVVNLGQRDATSRLAHVFCEMMLRSEAAGLAQSRSCPLPLTQQDLAEATGLSLVHVNRTIQDLRGQGLITFGQGRLTVLDWQRLVEVADFQAEYLHLQG